MFVQAYINTAQEILLQYKGGEPFSSFLKKFFAVHKKFGSRDRKQITHLCYCFFRLGKALTNVSLKERILIALLLCSSEKNALLERLKPEWNDIADKTLEDKIYGIGPVYPVKLHEIFPFRNHISDKINFASFSKAMLYQQDTYLRIRPGKKTIVLNKLKKAELPYKLVNDTCVAVAPASRIDAVLHINEEVVIQDLSSQQVLNPLFELQDKSRLGTAWDCCAASGGKSILLRDHFPKIELTVSDVRESILANLRKRFEQAGIRNYRWQVADIAVENFELKKIFDIVIADVPCSGSGTWGRTPEQLYFFDTEKIGYYSKLQKQILGNAVKSLKKNGFMVYCTCSVFKEENEEIIKFIEKNLSLKVLSSHYIKGYEQRADTLFSALVTL